MAAIPTTERGIRPTVPSRELGSRRRLPVTSESSGGRNQYDNFGIMADPKGSTIELLAANRELDGKRSGLVFRTTLPEQ